jgi:hypothetical protein
MDGSWELNTKPYKTIYQGLATRPNLTSLKIQFPLDRIPKPTLLIPAIPRLKYLHLANLDPLCYNDDVSLLLFEAQQLETLKLHWNPRIRLEREPSVHLKSIFGRIMASPRMLRLKHIALANLFSKNENEFMESMDLIHLYSLTFINCMNQDNPGTIFTDRTWDRPRTDEFRSWVRNVKAIRLDQAGTRLIGMMQGLEEIYLVPRLDGVESLTGRSPSSDTTPNGGFGEIQVSTPLQAGSVNGVSRQNTPLTPTSGNSPSWQHNQAMKAKHVVMASDSIACLLSNHATTLTKLLLPSFWSFGYEVAVNLITRCPNLIQLGIAIDDPSLEVFRAGLRAGPKIKAFRLLSLADHDPWKDLGEMELRVHLEVLGLECRKEEYNKVKFLGLGSHCVELCGMKGSLEDLGHRRDVRVVPLDDPRLRDVEIFSLDTLDI